MQENTLNPIVVSDYILWKRREIETTNLDVIKLTYLCHGWYLGIYDTPLISEPVEAWPYGPVIRSVYFRYKSFADNPIVMTVQNNSGSFSPRQQTLIDETLKNYKDFKTWELSAITHEPGTPWYQIRMSNSAEVMYSRSTIIPNDLIKDHYKKLYEDYHGK